MSGDILNQVGPIETFPFGLPPVRGMGPYHNFYQGNFLKHVFVKMLENPNAVTIGDLALLHSVSVSYPWANTQIKRVAEPRIVAL